MKTYGGVDVQIHVFLISASVGSEWAGLSLGRFTPGKIVHQCSLDRRQGGLQKLSEAHGEEKNLPLPGLEILHLSRPDCSQSLYRLEREKKIKE
jgi:hypothetical protein